MSPKNIGINNFSMFKHSRRDGMLPKQSRRRSKLGVCLKNLTMICFLVVSFLIISANQAFAIAPCTISPTTDVGGPSDIANIGSSFTACGTGKLSKIRVLSGTTGANYEMTIYDGNGIGGTVLGTKTGISVTAQKVRADLKKSRHFSTNMQPFQGGTITSFFWQPTALQLKHAVF